MKIFTDGKDFTAVNNFEGFECFNNSLEDGDTWVIRDKKTRQIVFEGTSLPSIKVWESLLNRKGFPFEFKALNNQQIKDLIDESDY